MSADSPVFLDTNVLVYAHDQSAGRKHEVAQEIIESLLDLGRVAISTQVMQEFYVTTVTKGHLLPDEARKALEDFRTWQVHRPDVDDLLLASELAEHSRLSFWDGLIVQSALSLGATTLLTEDLQHGLKINQLVVNNPFLD